MIKWSCISKTWLLIILLMIVEVGKGAEGDEGGASWNLVSPEVIGSFIDVGEDHTIHGKKKVHIPSFLQHGFVYQGLNDNCLQPLN